MVRYSSPAAAAGSLYVEEPVAYDAVLLAGFGGPEGQDDVIPFLRNVTRGRGIPDERLEQVAGHYRHFGGVSPINEHNRALRAALAAELSRRGIDLPVYWGNRNWAPYLRDAVTEAAVAGHRRLLGVATSAYSSYSSCRQYREDFARAVEEAGLAESVTIDKVRQYFDHPGFADAFVAPLAGALADLESDGIGVDRIRVLFTTHSIPVDDARRSGPRDRDFGDGGAYAAQHEAVAAYVMDRARRSRPRADLVPWRLVYQSRSGPASQPWLEPDIGDAIAAAARDGAVAIVIVPIGFVSDHMEVLWDLDTEAMAAARDAGVRAVRIPTPGTDPGYVAGLVDLIEERIAGAPAASRPHVTGIGPWFDVCPPGCCENVRAGFRPAVAGVAP